MENKKKKLDKRFQVMKRQKPWRDAYYYQKSEVIYQLTVCFCRRFLPMYGDRTVDQMVQAARSGKQNIIEGTEDGTTSTEMHIKLMNVARSSLQELREDYRDYLIANNLPIWAPGHPRYKPMQDFCRVHNRLEEYQLYLQKWSAEEMANTALTLCHMTDAMLNHHLQTLEQEFVEQGGIKERMHSARTGYRQKQDAELSRLRQEVEQLRQENARLHHLLSQHNINC